MQSKRENTRTKIADWAFVAVGLFLIGWQVYKYATDQIDNYGLETVVFLIGVLFLAKPQSLVDLVSSVAKRKSDSL